MIVKQTRFGDDIVDNPFKQIFTIVYNRGSDLPDDGEPDILSDTSPEVSKDWKARYAVKGYLLFSQIECRFWYEYYEYK